MPRKRERLPISTFFYSASRHFEYPPLRGGTQYYRVPPLRGVRVYFLRRAPPLRGVRVYFLRIPTKAVGLRMSCAILRPWYKKGNMLRFGPVVGHHFHALPLQNHEVALPLRSFLRHT